MKHMIFILSAALLLTACQDKKADSIDAAPAAPTAQDKTAALDPAQDPNFVPKPLPVKVPKDGRITVSPEGLVSEPSACILPLRVSNGTDATVSVSMFGFKVTGPGSDDSGNMFAQPTPPGEARTARVIMIGQSCEAFNTITIPEILCVSGDGDCPAPVDLESSDELTLLAIDPQ